MNANESEARISNVIWAYINNHDHEGLENHLEMTKNKIDITRLYNSSGFTPIHLAAYKGQNQTIQIMIDFVLGISRDKEGNEIQSIQDEKLKTQRKVLRTWINLQTQGEDSFTALHFASFHGNLSLIRMLIKHGADIFMTNKNGLSMIHVAAQGD